MEVIEAILLGIVQGLTEFIPVSSSGHLVLLHKFLGSPGSLAFDVALHIGTLVALICFFWRDVVKLFRGALSGIPGERRLVGLLVLATIPAVFSGLFLEDTVSTTFRSVYVVSFNLIFVALLMLGAEWLAKRRGALKALDKIHTSQALVIGAAQAVSIIPGISRSGSTITAGIFMGLERVAAMRFSFLMAMPVTFGAIVKVLMDSDSITVIHQDAGLFTVGILSAFLSGLLAIKFLLSYLSKHTLNVFAYYRIALGIVVLLVVSN